MSLDLTDDRGGGVGRELDLTREVKAVDGFDQTDRADLNEVLQRFPATAEATREVVHEGEVHRDELVQCALMCRIARRGRVEKQEHGALAIAVPLPPARAPARLRHVVAAHALLWDSALIGHVSMAVVASREVRSTMVVVLASTLAVTSFTSEVRITQPSESVGGSVRAVVLAVIAMSRRPSS